MKSFYSLTIIFIILANNLSLVFSAAADDIIIPTLVLDKSGTALRSGESYHISIVVTDHPGALTIGKTDDSDCAYLVSSQDDSSRGLSVKFHSTDIFGSVFTGRPIEIEFVAKPACVESAKWLVFVDSELDPLPIHYVGIGGPENYPSHTQIFDGTFSIQRSELFPLAYTLNYCRMDHCSYVGINKVLIGNESDRRLMLRQAIVVVFEHDRFSL